MLRVCGNDWQQAIEMLDLHSLDHDAAREAAQLVRQGGKSNRERALKLESYGRHCVDARRAGAALTVCANAMQWQPALALLERPQAFSWSLKMPFYRHTFSGLRISNPRGEQISAQGQRKGEEHR